MWCQQMQWGRLCSTSAMLCLNCLREVAQWPEGNGLRDPGRHGVVAMDVMITTSFQRLPNIECNHHKARHVQYV